MDKENLVNLTLTSYIEGKRSSEKQQVTYLTHLSGWMVQWEQKRIVQGQKLKSNTKKKN